MKIKEHYENGDYFEGEVNAAGVAEGYGVYRFSDGSEYRGYYKADEWNGDGEFTSHGWRFTGRFKDGYFDDFFRIVKPDGTVIMGIFRKGWFNERGELVGMQGTWTIYSKDGASYEGEVNGFLEPHGNGKFTTTHGCVVEGRFENGYPGGLVTYTQQGGPVMRGNMYGQYFKGTWTIDWVDDGIHMTAELIDGYRDTDDALRGIQSATITYKNGDHVAMRFEDGYMDIHAHFHGIQSATVTLHNGDVYTGRLNPQLQFSGYGALRKRDGVIEAGIWEYGRLVQRDKSNSRSYVETLHLGSSVGSGTRTQTVLWTILENSAYHCLLIYSGDDTSGTPRYRIETSEINKVFAGSQPYTFIRDYQSGDIAFTVVRESVHGVFHVRTGNNPHMALNADVRYTIKGDLIAVGEDNLMNNITYRIRDLGYKKIVEYY